VLLVGPVQPSGRRGWFSNGGASPAEFAVAGYNSHTVMQLRLFVGVRRTGNLLTILGPVTVFVNLRSR